MRPWLPVRNVANAAQMANRPTKLVVLLMLAMLPTPAAFAAPDTVFFPSADGSDRNRRLSLQAANAGALTPPSSCCTAAAGPTRPTSTRDCTLVYRVPVRRRAIASGSSKRHMMWGPVLGGARLHCTASGQFWTPRPRRTDFDRFTHDDPDRTDVNEKTVRPLDAEGALSWLRSQRTSSPNRIFLRRAGRTAAAPR